MSWTYYDICIMLLGEESNRINRLKGYDRVLDALEEKGAKLPSYLGDFTSFFIMGYTEENLVGYTEENLVKAKKEFGKALELWGSNPEDLFTFFHHTGSDLIPGYGKEYLDIFATDGKASYEWMTRISGKLFPEGLKALLRDYPVFPDILLLFQNYHDAQYRGANYYLNEDPELGDLYLSRTLEYFEKSRDLTNLAGALRFYPKGASKGVSLLVNRLKEMPQGNFKDPEGVKLQYAYEHTLKDLRDLIPLLEERSPELEKFFLESVGNADENSKRMLFYPNDLPLTVKKNSGSLYSFYSNKFKIRLPELEKLLDPKKLPKSPKDYPEVEI